MILQQYQKVGGLEGELAFTPIPLQEVFSAMRASWRVIAWATGVGVLLAVGGVLLIPNRYTSIAQLMPPDPQTFASPPSVLTVLTGTGLASANLGQSLLNQHTPAGTLIGILESREVLNDIINRFDLRRVYGYKYYFETRDKLKKNTAITEDKKSGIITIAVTDRDKHRAQLIAQAYIFDLNQLVNSLSTSSARRERVFLEERLKTIKDNLDASSRALSEFSSSNSTLDIEKQGQATVEAASKLEGEVISAQSDLAGLEAVYADDNVHVQAARRRIGELQNQLQKIAGEKEAGSPGQPESPMPSIRTLPLLGVTYYDLYRQVTLQEAIYETLSKQYELAKVREAEEIPPIKVLDSPDFPERKSWPHRSVVVLVTGLLCFAGSLCWAFMRHHNLAENAVS